MKSLAVVVVAVLAFCAVASAQIGLGISIPLYQETSTKVHSPWATMAMVDFVRDGLATGYQGVPGQQICFVRHPSLKLRVRVYVNLPNKGDQLRRVEIGIPSSLEVAQACVRERIPETALRHARRKEYIPFWKERHGYDPESDKWTIREAGEWTEAAPVLGTYLYECEIPTTKFEVGRTVLVARVTGKINREEGRVLLFIRTGRWTNGEVLDVVHMVCRWMPKEWSDFSKVSDWDLFALTPLNDWVMWGFQSLQAMAPVAQQPQQSAPTATYNYELKLPELEKKVEDHDEDVQPRPEPQRDAPEVRPEAPPSSTPTRKFSNQTGVKSDQPPRVVMTSGVENKGVVADNRLPLSVQLRAYQDRSSGVWFEQINGSITRTQYIIAVIEGWSGKALVGEYLYQGQKVPFSVQGNSFTINQKEDYLPGDYRFSVKDTGSGKIVNFNVNVQ